MKQYASILVLFLTMSGSVWAGGVEERSFASPQQEQQYKKLVNELRCLVCQNQNLADSNAELAQDLREEIYGMIQKGLDDKQVVAFMVDRYGWHKIPELLESIGRRKPWQDAIADVYQDYGLDWPAILKEWQASMSF